MVLDGTVISHPADATGERPVGDAILILAKLVTADIDEVEAPSPIRTHTQSHSWSQSPQSARVPRCPDDRRLTRPWAVRTALYMPATTWKAGGPGSRNRRRGP
jgi:hypothetical protein